MRSLKNPPPSGSGSANDSRAALEERARLFLESDESKSWSSPAIFADFAEQESSSLKLLLSAIFSGRAHFWKHPTRQLDIYGGGAGYTNFPVELDSSGIPVLTPEIIEALEAAK